MKSLRDASTQLWLSVPPPIHTQGTSVQAFIDGKMVTTQTVTQGAGFVGFGVGGFYAALFDDFSVMAGKVVP